MARIDFNPAAHRYRVDGRPQPSVTTVLGNLAKPALVGWAAKMAAEYADTNWHDLAQLTSEGRRQRIAAAYRTQNDQAKTRGTSLHTIAQDLVAGKPVAVTEHQAETTAYARFLDQWDIQPLGVETLLASTTYGYAGTADLWATIGALDGQRALLDLKSGKGVYPEAALQLAAYRWADFLQDDDGAELPVPDVDACYCIHLDAPAGDDGTRAEPVVRLVPMNVTRDTLNTFLALLDVHRWKRAHAVGEELTRKVATP